MVLGHGRGISLAGLCEANGVPFRRLPGFDLPYDLGVPRWMQVM